MREFTREQGHTTKTPDIIGGQNDGYVEGQEISGDTASAPVLPLDIIWRRLELLCFSGQICRLLQGHLNLRRLECRSQHIAFVNDIAESRDNIPVSMNALMKAFACPRYLVQAGLAHGLNEPGQG
jgi:hypothetical protein